MTMAPSLPTYFQIFQPYPLHTLLFTTQISNNGIFRTRPSKQPVPKKLSFSATNPTLEQTNTSPIKQTTTNDLVDFEDRTTRFRIKGLVDRITSLSSSYSKTQMMVQILEHKDAEFQTISDFNHLLMALVVAHEPEICLSIFKELPSFQLVPDCCTYSIMIRCHCEKNDVDEAKKVLEAILDNGSQPDAATVTVLVNSLCKRGKVQKAMEVFELMGKVGSRPGVQAYNCLLKGLSYVGKVEQAFDMLMGMKGTSLEPDVYSYTAVMDGLCKVGRSDEAMELLNEAVEMGLAPNVVAFNTLLQGYSREGRPMEGVAVLKMMQKHGCIPDCISYSTVLHGLLKWNEVLAALGVYKEMVGLGLEVNVRIMGALVRRLCKRSWKERGLLQDAEEVFEKMKERGLVVDHRTLEVMVQTLCREKRFDEAFAILNDMVRLGYSAGAFTFHNVIQGLCSRGKVDEGVSTFILLHASGGIPDRISYDVLIKELNAQGRVFCASYLFGVALKQGLVPNRVPLLCEYYEIEERGTVTDTEELVTSQQLKLA